MRITTLQYRIKDESTAQHLNKMAGAVNFVWNYCNQANKERWGKFYKTFSAYELHGMRAGCAQELGLHSQTVQAVADQLSKSRKQVKKVKPGWRSCKRCLGWIPFKASGVKLKEDVITYCGHTFRLWFSRPIEGKVRFGSFCQDTKGHWFVSLVIRECSRERLKTGKEVGIDLGLKTIAALSDGNQLDRNNLSKKHEDQLTMAQRTGKKRRLRGIHTKIRNKRKDGNHKQTTALVRQYDRIIAGDVSSSKLIKTRMAKSVADAGWARFKTMLAYKADALGVEVKVLKESFSTVTCSNCKERTGPTGLSGLSVRQWECSACGRNHHRDVNAAMNILLSAQGIVRRRESLTL